ncbi:argininosuccinate lyase [candidate division KSB1 bacterium]|nr:argininosuccinate lyase [candidate division KSB1 bacterium]RQW11490.1 MAG: argininosuccinate lyase [candidate division KSB1 bacterium]
MSADKIWSNRFERKTDALMEQFSTSLPFDQKLFDADIAVNKAWAQALAAVGIYTAAEKDDICAALDSIQHDFHANALSFPAGVEDIHSANERWLIDRCGEAGAKIHTGRSRNDQVVTDLKLYLRDHNQALQRAVHSLQSALVETAANHIDTVMPGQTHMRQAQPISFAHYLLALFFQLERDRQRLKDTQTRCNTMPLGSGALAGAAFAVDRHALAAALGFAAPTENSYDATADRDFVNEHLYCCSQIMVHLSRAAEDFIIWSSEGYRFMEVDERYATGSSMMPQKRNPDSLELIRGKSARVIGNQVIGLCLLKGAPTAYVRDLQEDKEPIFDSLQQTIDSALIFAGVVHTLIVYPENMRKALDPALYATDVADYLVRKGLPFRQAHGIVGSLVALAERQGQTLQSLSIDIYRKQSTLFEPDVYSLFDPQASLRKREIIGGTGKKSVETQINRAQELLEL